MLNKPGRPKNHKIHYTYVVWADRSGSSISCYDISIKRRLNPLDEVRIPIYKRITETKTKKNETENQNQVDAQPFKTGAQDDFLNFDMNLQQNEEETENLVESNLINFMEFDDNFFNDNLDHNNIDDPNEFSIANWFN